MKLLNKTVRYYLIYAGIVLLVAIPVLYFIIQGIVREDVDESLLVHKEQIQKKMNQAEQPVHVGIAEMLEAGLSIQPSLKLTLSDSFYTVNDFDSVSNEYIPYRVLESNILVKNISYTVKLRNSLVDSSDLIETIVMVMTLLLIVISAGHFFITRAISKKVWKPFYITLDKLHKYRVDHDEEPSFEPTSVNEFTELNLTIASLVQRNSQVYHTQKEFTENASHEMQTPLAVLQHKLELLMQTEPLTQEQAELINDLANAGQRMNRLNKSLLLLSKIENNQFADTEPVSVKEITEKLLEQYKFQAEKKGIALNIFFPEDIFIVVNKPLLEILISNLISNAIKFTSIRGKIRVAADHSQFTIENTAEGKSLDTDRLFRRFQKQNSDNKSVGLGLEIANRIALLHKFSLSYRFEGNTHIFIVKY